jgi:hypothetical protein
VSGRRIVVTVDPDGTVRAQTQGVLGERCLDYVAVLEDLIDGHTTESAYTDDYQRSEGTVAERQEDRDIDRS